MPDLIVVSGAPASGKSTLAERLAADLGFPLLAKDDIKEAIGDGMPVADPEAGRGAGLAAMLVLYRTAARLRERGVPVVLESFFDRRYCRDDLRPLFDVSSPLLIHCVASVSVRESRYRDRVAGGERHPVHFDAWHRGRLAEQDTEPPELPVPTIVVDTTRDYDPGYPEILAAACG